MADSASAKTSTVTVRPTKKQRALLDFIGAFIDEHGYSPSYREIMNGCNYNSIATVAVHINNLINRGHLRKRDHSARSLELTNPADANESAAENTDFAAQETENWLNAKVEELFKRLEINADDEVVDHEDLQTVIDAFELLGLQASADRFAERLTSLEPPTD